MTTNKKLSRQQKRILDYIREFGSITSYEAFRDLRICKATTRISELRRMGYAIESEVIADTNRYGEPTHYYKYFMQKQLTNASDM